MPPGDHCVLRFGSFEIDTHARVLRKSGVMIRLQGQPLEVLLALLECPGEIVTREQLRQRLWPEGTFVDFDHALNTAMKKIRAALCDAAVAPRYIETIPRRGYRFLASLDKSTTTQVPLGEECIRLLTPCPVSRRMLRATVVATVLSVVCLLLSAWVISRSHTSKSVALTVLPFTEMDSTLPDKYASEVFPSLLWRQLRRAHPRNVIIGDRVGGPADGALHSSVQTQIEYVVQGSVLRSQARLRLVVQLVRLKDQNCIWSQDFDREASDAKAEMEIAQEIVQQMQRVLSSLTVEPR
ncbi:MAG TPA: winged helix-turn-helix domain-containing protein [Terriglobales bacterium]|nr:winged helix-turn-helix domain-containing protein [Terriglobales bacterium]